VVVLLVGTLFYAIVAEQKQGFIERIYTEITEDCLGAVVGMARVLASDKWKPQICDTSVFIHAALLLVVLDIHELVADNK